MNAKPASMPTDTTENRHHLMDKLKDSEVKSEVCERGRGYVEEAKAAAIALQSQAPLRKQASRALRKQLRSLEQVLDSFDERGARTEKVDADWTEVFETKGLGRRVHLVANEAYHQDTLPLLGNLYRAETEFLEEVQRDTIDQVFGKAPVFDGVTEQQSQLLEKKRAHDEMLSSFKDIYKHTTEATDDLVMQCSATNERATALSDETLGIESIDDEMLLEHFWAVCEHPSEAELWMLSEFCEEPVENITAWFDLKAGREAAHLSDAAMRKQRESVSSPKAEPSTAPPPKPVSSVSELGPGFVQRLFDEKPQLLARWIQNDPRLLAAFKAREEEDVQT